MDKQSRRIYQTGNAALDMILTDIGTRLDGLEGLRPDLETGLMTLTEGIVSITENDFITSVDGVTLTDNLITLTESSIVIRDEDGEIIHKME